MSQIETQILSWDGTQSKEGNERDLFLLIATANQKFQSRAMMRRDIGFAGCKNPKGRHQLYGYNNFDRLPDEKRLYGIHCKFKGQIDRVLQEASDPKSHRYSAPIPKWSKPVSGKTTQVDPAVLPSLISDSSPEPPISREDAEDIEAAIVRGIATCGSAHERLALFELWLVVMYRLTNGLTIKPAHDLVVLYRLQLVALRTCALQAPLREIVMLEHERFGEELKLSEQLFGIMFSIRDDVSDCRAGDVMHCGFHAAYQCPNDSTFDRDWSMTKQRQMAAIPAVGERTSIAHRVTTAPVFHRGNS